MMITTWLEVFFIFNLTAFKKRGFIRSSAGSNMYNGTCWSFMQGSTGAGESLQNSKTRNELRYSYL